MLPLKPQKPTQAALAVLLYRRCFMNNVIRLFNIFGFRSWKNREIVGKLWCAYCKHTWSILKAETVFDQLRDFSGVSSVRSVQF